jgi:hypothetical protein
MGQIIQDVIVALIVAGCAVFSVWRLMSGSARLKTLELLTPIANAVGASAAITKLRGKVLAQLASGCAACSSNKTAVRHHTAGPRR